MKREKKRRERESAGAVKEEMIFVLTASSVVNAPDLFFVPELLGK